MAERRQVHRDGGTEDEVAARLAHRRCSWLPRRFWFLLLLVLPLVVVLVYSFGERAPAGGYAAGLHPGPLRQPSGALDRVPEHADPGAAGHAVCLLSAYPLAYFLAVKASARWRCCC